MNRTQVAASLLAVAFTAGMAAAGGPPVGDECEDCIPIGEGNFAGDTCDNTGVDDDTSCALSDTIDEWYCYTASFSGTAFASFCVGGGTADYDTTLAVFDACGGTELACNDDTCGLLSQISWDISAGTTYYIRVAGFNLSCGTYTLDVGLPTYGLLRSSIDCGGSEVFSTGGGGCGDCALPDPKSQSGCSDPVCQDIVCALDPFCCDTAWDGICADAAISNCECGSGIRLRGTIGQTDTGVMIGDGGLVVVGGFWGGGESPCPWDCGDGDGLVGIVDFLALLGQWDMVGTSCDFDGEGVGIVDLLKQLAAWGPCVP